jgi:hypothetical protein
MEVPVRDREEEHTDVFAAPPPPTDPWEPDEQWFTRSRVGLAIAAVLVLVGLVLLARAVGNGTTMPRARFAGLALVVTGGVAGLAPAVLWRDLTNAARLAASRAERAHMAALGTIIAAGAAVRIALVDLPMRYDESTTFLAFVNRPIAAALADYAIPNNHLFNTALMHYAWRALGTDPVVLRLPVLFAGVALVPAMYLAGRALYGRTVGLLAAALTVLSGALVEYSVNARGYAFVVLATVTLLALGVYAVRRRNLAAWVIWAAVAALGLWSVPTMVYALAIVVVWLAMLVALDVPRERRRTAALLLEHGLLLAGALAFVLYQPTLGQPGFAYSDQSLQSDLPEKLWHAFSTGYGPLWWLVVAGAIAAVVLHRRVSPWRAPLWGAILIVVPITLVASDRVPPFVRTWVFLLPMLLLLGAAGAVAVARVVAERRPETRRPLAAVAIASAVAVVGAALLGAGDIYTDDDWPIEGAPEQAAYLAAHMRPGDGLAVGRYTAPAHDFYLRRHGVRTLMSVGPLMGLQGADRGAGHRTFVALLDTRPVTAREAVAALPFLQGMRLVRRTPGGEIYVWTEADGPRRSASRTGGTPAPPGP